MLLASFALSVIGCSRNEPAQTRSSPVERIKNSKRENSARLINTVSSALNELPDEIVLDLAPPKPILDDSKSLDGKEVRATCSVTPAVPDGPYNYLHVVGRNVNLRKLGVRAGDVVRYFVAADPESVEFGIRQQTYVELPVRRLDVNDPNYSLIIEGGLPFPVDVPERMEIWRFSDKRMNEIRVRLTRYIKQRKPAIDWEPSPDESALALLVDRTNQWLRNLSKKEDDWQVDPLLENIPQSLSESKILSKMLLSEELNNGQFQPFEARELQQAIWLRDVSRWAKADGFSDIDVAKNLFDWTVRNIQLDAPGGTGVVHRPWQILMYGHGTVEQRAWIFAELCRQQQLDVVMLGIGSEAGSEEPRWWLPALLADEQLYLFDAQLGLPIPGPEAGEIATLADVVAEPALLEKLNVDAEFTYPVGAADLEHVSAMLVASPLQLAHRATLLEQALEGDAMVVLGADNRRVKEALEGNSNISDVQLWTQPFKSVLDERAMKSAARLAAAQRFQVFAQLPQLWKARVLHFQGTKEVPFDEQDDPLAEAEQGHLEATRLYHNKRVRPPDAKLDQLAPGRQVVYRTSKGDASYWLGLLSYDRGNHEVAADWLGKRTLDVAPNGTWAAGARYNLARTYEVLGKYAEAVELLESDDSPQRHGNLLRARQVKALIEGQDSDEEASASDEENGE